MLFIVQCSFQASVSFLNILPGYIVNLTALRLDPNTPARPCNQENHVRYLQFKDMRKLQYCTAIQIKFGTQKLNPSNQRNKKSNLERKENIKGIELVKPQNKNQV